MNGKTFRNAAVVCAALAIVATACAPSAPTGGASAAPSAAASAAATAAGTPARGGTVVFAIWQEPTTLAPLYANQTVAGVVNQIVVEGLAFTDPDGNYVPQLAKSLPTTGNGGVTLSADGKKMTVKWELQPGLKWADGDAVTSQDILFTWQTYMKDPNVVSRAGFSEIEKIDTPDDLTALVTYKSLYGPYPTNFYAILPKHLLQNVADISKTDYNRKPLGTGPFKITEFKAGDSIVAERNDLYRKKGQPYLDKIIFRSVPSSTVAIAQLKAGEVQGMWNLLESETPEIEKDSNLVVAFSPSNSVERIEMNLAINADPSDPTKPHPILGDVNVRRALISATPKQVLVDKLLFGKARVGSSVSPQGWAADKAITQESYDTKKAEDLLDQAGWKRGPDGIRTKGGVKMSLTINTTTGNKTREQVEQVLVDEWKQRGIDLKIVNMPSSVFLSGSWDDKDPRQRGSYDLALYTTSASIDPGVHMSQRYHSRQIPTEQNKSGQNRVRISDPELDKMIDDAGAMIDQAKRKELYGKIFRKINEIAPAIWLYERGRIDAFRTSVAGWKAHAWGDITWNVEDWSLKK